MVAFAAGFAAAPDFPAAGLLVVPPFFLFAFAGAAFLLLEADLDFWLAEEVFPPAELPVLFALAPRPLAAPLNTFSQLSEYLSVDPARKIVIDVS